MSKNLVIVESPAKAKTIEGYLGKDFHVTSSYGHVRDLPKGDKAIDIEHGFSPTYVVSKDKNEVVKNLKKLAKESEMVYLASDDDREGEAISWHLMQALDLNEKNTRRIVFREITKNAIANAMQSPRGIDIDLVNAQQARRVLDRLVGYEISPVLWRKIKTGLSAGRVQSVAVRLVVEREREIEKFESVGSFKISAFFKLGNGANLQAELPAKFDTPGEAEDFLKKCIGAEFSIVDLQKKPAKKSPAPPFTTSTLQQEASRKLGFSVSQTMTVAQKLYESGQISYMRTDSVNLSQEALNSAKDQIIKSYGEAYSKTRHFKTKSAGAQEAHEAIRPTNFNTKEAGADYNGKRLYDLIWKRAIASQMSEAQLERTTVNIAISTTPENLIASGEVIKFEGFLKVYIESTDEENGESEQKGMLPPIQIGEILNMETIQAKEGFSRHPARYTEASLVKKLEEMGIGRPSTYAPTISTIQKRNYSVKESRQGKERKFRVISLEGSEIISESKTEITGAEKNKLFPTDMGIIVNDFLVENFTEVVDYSFTAIVEKEFDAIAQGDKKWNEMIEGFYGGFHEVVENIKEDKESFVNNIRELGNDPDSGSKVIARMGKFGPIAQIGENGGEEKPKYASLRKDQLIENITLEEALDLFKLPRSIGTFEEEDLNVGIGRYGPYIRHAGKFYSLTEDDDPYTIETERAIELVLEKRKAEANKVIKSFPENEEIQVLNGRYGPYIKAGKKNVRIPKGTEPSELTLEECLELAEKAPEGRKKFRKK
jgi:DNA topoisomerase-1